jgi:redox-sensitive bicupin YhaK (pirin superfamily)
MVQLWVNLPKSVKMRAPRYQGIVNAQIPRIALPDGAGQLRVIAGAFGDKHGPAETFTPLNLWDLRLNAHAAVMLDLPEGHNAMLAVLAGRVTVDGQSAGEAEIIRFGTAGAGARVVADSDAIVLVLTGEPIDEPVVGYGPFVMTSTAEIRQAIDDFNSGRFGQMPAA